MISLRLATSLFVLALSGVSIASTVGPKAAIERSSGTGFSITNDGYILTSAHLVDSQSAIGVRSPGDSAQRRARLVAIDRKLDLALLKVDAKTIPIPIGDWNLVADGQDVVALGFPNPSTQGYSLKITSGIVSSRIGTTSNDAIFPFNAAVQSGSSGGPVFSMMGSVVGVIYGFSVANGNPNQPRDSLSYAVNALHVRRFLDRQGITYAIETPSQPSLRAQELFEKYEQGIFLVEVSAEEATSSKGRQRKKKDDLQGSAAELPEKLRGLLKTLPEREQPRLFGAYKAGYDQIEEWSDSYILVKSTSIKPEESSKNSIIIFDSIISYKTERKLSSGEPYLSLIMSARFDCTDLLIEIVRQEFKPEAFGSGKSIIAKRKPAEAQAQWSPIRSEKRREIIRSAVCGGGLSDRGAANSLR